MNVHFFKQSMKLCSSNPISQLKILYRLLFRT